MEAFRHHVFVCHQPKPEGVPGCVSCGAEKVLETLLQEVARRGLSDEVQVTPCGSFGLCERGPNLVVYPEGVWYSGVTPGDVPEIVESQLRQNRVVERLANRDAGALREEILANRKKRQVALQAKDASGALPDELMQTIRGFQESRAILTAIELDVFTAVGQAGTAAEVARKLGTDARAAEMLLNALVAMGLLTKQEGTFRNTPVAARYFTAGSADDARLGLLHSVNLWTRWSTLTDCVRAGTAVLPHEAGARIEDWTRSFIAAMHRNAAERAPQVVKAVGAAGVNRMLDVGGGSGAYAIAFASAHAQLHVDLLDLPGVLPIAQGHIERAGLSSRIKTHAGDLRGDEFGKDYDLVIVSAICHMLSAEENLDLLKRCCRALAPKGRIVIQDFILEADKTAPKSAALFALNMLVGTRNGSTYSAEEYTAWMRSAGFAEVKHIRLPGPSGLIMGTRGEE